jgi:hypothetical protein
MSLTLPTSNTYRPYNPIWEAGIVGEFNAPGNYIINEAAPPIAVGDANLKSGQILKVKAGELKRSRGDALLWGAGSSTPKGVGVSLDTAVTYTVKRFGEAVPEDLDSAVTEGDLVPGGKTKLNLLATLEGLKIQREAEFLSLCSSTYTGSDQAITAGAGWNEAGGDPIANIKAAAEYVSRSGFDADTMLMGADAWWALMNNDALVERMSSAGSRHGMSKSAFAQLMQDLFGVDRVLVSKVRRNTANVGATSNEAYVLGDTCIVYKRMEGGERVSNESGDIAVAPGWLARVQAYDLALDNYEDDDAAVRWHRARFAEGLAVASTSFAASISNVVI